MSDSEMSIATADNDNDSDVIVTATAEASSSIRKSKKKDLLERLQKLPQTSGRSSVWNSRRFVTDADAKR